jgi:spore maturation protein CgeB
MNWKETAKKWPLMYWINAKLKCYELKQGLARFALEYNFKAAVSGFNYDADKAIDEFKRRHRRYCPAFIPAPLGSLRVFWVGTNQDQDESGFLQALHRLAKVTVFHNIEGEYGSWSGKATVSGSSSFEEIRRANDETLLEQVVQAHSEERIDLLLGQMWASLISKESLAKVQAMGIPVINISMDDRLPVHWTRKGDIRLGSVGLAPSLDMVLTTSPETCLWYGVEGCPALYWPLASDPRVFSQAEGGMRDIDVLFIGNKYGVRGQIVRYLNNHDVKVDCYGSGWPNGYINAEQMAELSKRARIILGVGTVGHCQDVYTLKLRDFDAPMSGALYLTHRNPDLCRLYDEGEEIECYTTPKEALNKIRFYLEHHEDLARVAKNGQNKALFKDSWDQRLLSTFEQVGLLQSK